MAGALGVAELKTKGWRGGNRPLGYLSSALSLLLLAATPSAFSQEQKPVQTAGSSGTSKPTSGAAAETNDRIAQLAQASEVKPGEYTVGAGDLLGVEVFDVPELSRDVRVSETGYITLPLLPTRIRAQGLTPFQLQDKLA